MNMRIFASILVLVLLLGADAYAQDYWFGFEYNTVMASGDAANFIGDWSWRGGSFGGRRLVRENTTVGFWTGWHVMNEVSAETVSFRGEENNLDFSGTQYRYLNSFPIMVNGHWYGGTMGRFRPYIGLNVGTYFIERRVEVGLFVFDDDNWHFGLAPEVGVTFPLGWRARGLFNARFNWAASTGGSGDITYWNLGFGVAWM
jgi:outer membrane protein W